jgi:hypothetical protein
MSEPFALEPVAVEPSRARLATLELELAAGEADLAATREDLHVLQSRYLSAVGAYYRQLVDIEAEAVDLEVRLGLREPVTEDDVEDDGGEARRAVPALDDECGHAAAPSGDLKKIFRNIARTLHPDLALDEPARWRRHSLMAEANRAYAERDEDRLRLILHAWERSPEAVVGDDPQADDERRQRRIAAIEDRLLAIDAEFRDLRSSAIWRLKGKIDDARVKGWDLFAEMVLEVTREVGRATSKLASLRRMATRIQV